MLRVNLYNQFTSFVLGRCPEGLGFLAENRGSFGFLDNLFETKNFDMNLPLSIKDLIKNIPKNQFEKNMNALRVLGELVT